MVGVAVLTSSIADNREEDDANKLLADAAVLNKPIDGVDQELRSDGNQNSDDCKQDKRHGHARLRLFLFFSLLFLPLPLTSSGLRIADSRSAGSLIRNRRWTRLGRTTTLGAVLLGHGNLIVVAILVEVCVGIELENNVRDIDCG